jgi:hypothetical protein
VFWNFFNHEGLEEHEGKMMDEWWNSCKFELRVRVVKKLEMSSWLEQPFFVPGSWFLVGAGATVGGGTPEALMADY